MGLIGELNKVIINNKDNIALESDIEGLLTYGELGQFSDSLANNLKEEKEKVIAVYMEKSFDLVITIIGILKSGNAYLPLDISYPKERIQNMIEDAEVSKIICSKKTSSMFEGDERVLVVNNIASIDTEDNTEERKQKESEKNLAYVIYTSGSTGIPKGVEIEHDAILNTVKWRIRYYNLSPKDKVLQLPSISFDSSVEDIFSTLLSGGTLVLFPEDKKLDIKYLARQIKDKEITHILTVPSFYNVLLEALQEDIKLRFVVIAGEQFTYELVKKHYERLKNVALYNEYGPTENSVCSMVHKLSVDEKVIYIGKPIDNVEYIIFNQDEEKIGELWLTGNGLARGYCNDEKQTAKSFIFKDGKKYYKMGDYVKESDNRLLQFCGRRDQQIKINGIRFDLNEIDNIIQKNNIIIDSKTVINEENDIITFFIGRIEIKEEEVKKELIKTIPKQFMPKKYYQVKEFLRLPNGKIDIYSMINTVSKEQEKLSLDNDDTIYFEISSAINKEFNARLTKEDYNLDLKQSGILSSIEFIKLLVILEEFFKIEFDFMMLEDIKKISVRTLGDIIKKG